MPLDNPTIIAERFPEAGARRAARIVLALALSIGAAGALYYATQSLTLSHYDARAHVVVARRVIDSLTPGWRQFGAVWLPFPHALNVIPVQWDWAYRTGASGVAISIAALAWGLSACAAYLWRRTGSTTTAVALPLALLLNPNVLYLQSTPMTEPLLFGLALAEIDAVDRFARATDDRLRARAGWILAALVMTRYEGWPIAAVLVAVTAAARGGAALRLAVYPAAAIAAFLLLARASTGVWFVASGFFVPDNPSGHNASLVLGDIVTSTRALAGTPLVWMGTTGALVCLWRARATLAALAPLALAAAGTLPFAAFYQGHPLRVRYMVTLIIALGVLAGTALSLLPSRLRAAGAVLVFALCVWVRPPLQSDAPMVTEAQWETPWRLQREGVTDALRRIYDGTPILASMGSLGHYMQESSRAGLVLSNFLHEGNGDLWTDALRWPRRHVRWILIEERAEGGDALAQLARERVDFLEGFDRVIERGGLVLYRRRD